MLTIQERVWQATAGRYGMRVEEGDFRRAAMREREWAEQIRRELEPVRDVTELFEEVRNERKRAL